MIAKFFYHIFCWMLGMAVFWYAIAPTENPITRAKALTEPVKERTVYVFVEPNDEYSNPPPPVGPHNIKNTTKQECGTACKVIVGAVAFEVLGANVSGTVRSIGRKIFGNL